MLIPFGTFSPGDNLAFIADAPSSGTLGITTNIGVGGSVTPILSAAQLATSQIGPLTSSATINAPASPVPNTWFMLQIIQGSGTPYGVTFNAFYHGLSAFVLDQTVSTQAALLFQVNAAGTAAQLMDVPQNGAPVA